MEKTNPCFPSNYVTIHDLRDRWLKRQQQQLNHKEQNLNQHHQHEDEEVKQHQPQQEELKPNQQKQSSRIGVFEKPELVVVQKPAKSEEKKKRPAKIWKNKRERTKHSLSTAAVSESVKHAPSVIESVANTPSEIEDAIVKPRVRKVTKKGRNRSQRPKIESETNGNEKTEAVVAEEKKSESVTNEIEAKFENLSMASMDRLNVGRGGGGGRERYTSGGFRKSDAGSGGGSRRVGGGRSSSRTIGFGPQPGPNQVWVKKGDAVD